MLPFLRRRWFLLAILLVIPLGLRVGFRARPDTVQHFPAWIVQVFSGIMTAVILFLMSVTLESRKLMASFRSPGPVLWAAAINYVLLPLVAMLLLPWQQNPEFAVGLMVISCVPGSLAAATVWTRKAGGNDAIAMLVTVLTNSVCFLVTPGWLQLGLGNTIDLDAQRLILELAATALFPILLGQVCRLSAKIRGYTHHARTGFGIVAEACILLIIFWAAVQSGVKLNSTNSGGQSLSAVPSLIVWLSCLIVHLAGIAAAILGGRMLQFRREDISGTVFASSQKTLPISIFVTTSLAGGGVSFSVIPVLMYYGSQLVLDTFLVEPLSNWVHSDRNQPRT